MSPRPSVLRLTVLALAAAALVACGSDGGGEGNGSFTASAQKEVSPAVPASGCGAVDLPMPKDPDGVLAALPKEAQAQYAGYTKPVSKSAWTNFKPDHGPPYKVGMSFAQLTADSQVGMYNSIKKALESDPDIEFTGVTTGSQLNIPQQQQQMQSLLNDNPDLLIVEPLTDAFGKIVDQAAKKGIPTISIQGTTSSNSVVNMGSNNYGSAVQGASAALRKMGGKGNVLYVHGIASSEVDLEFNDGYKAVMKTCPGAKQVGEIAGAFVPATAKAETLKFLATHPQQIDAVVQTGGMAPGIIEAFEQAGRPVPIVVDTGGMKGSLGYWVNNSKYKGFGGGFPPNAYGNAIADVAKRMLAGRGLKASEVINFYPAISQDNLDQWGESAWNLRTKGVAEGPANAFFGEDFIASMFNDPKPVD